MSGSLWYTFSNSTTASATEVNGNFEWSQGHNYPHSNGVLANDQFDLGNTNAGWRNSYRSGEQYVGATSTAMIRTINLNKFNLHGAGEANTSTGYRFNALGGVATATNIVYGLNLQNGSTLNSLKAYFNYDSGVGVTNSSITAVMNVERKQKGTSTTWTIGSITLTFSGQNGIANTISTDFTNSVVDVDTYTYYLNTYLYGKGFGGSGDMYLTVDTLEVSWS